MKKWTPELVAEARRLLKEGKTGREIGVALGVSKRTAWRWATGERRQEPKTTTGDDTPTRQPWKKHTPEREAAARRLREAGVSYEKIGEALGVADNTVRKWLDPQYMASYQAAQQRYLRRNPEVRNATRRQRRREAQRDPSE